MQPLLMERVADTIANTLRAVVFATILILWVAAVVAGFVFAVTVLGDAWRYILR